MPCCDAYIPHGALGTAAERKLVARVTEILVEHEMRRILDLMHEPEEIEAMRRRAQAIAWTFVHRTDTYVNGELAEAPCYRFVASIPEGQIDDRFAPAINKDILAAIGEAEGGKWPHPERRLWVHVVEILDGRWGAGGRTLHLKDIVDFVAKDWGQVALERWTKKKQEEAAAWAEMAEAGRARFAEGAKP